jgi:hypothetical protein
MRPIEEALDGLAGKSEAVLLVAALFLVDAYE